MATPKLPDADDLIKMNRADLLELQKTLAAALEKNAATAMREARDEIERIARESGFALSEIMEVKPHRTSAFRRKSNPKFRDPKNSENIWTGIGRKPKWFIERTEEGVPEDAMLVG